MKMSACILLTLSIFSGNARADANADGEAAYEKGNYTQAIEIFRPLAERGVASAQGNLGFMYYLGKGVPKDYQEAVKWSRLSAAQGITDAQYNLGIMYAKGQGVPQDNVQGYMWLSFAASKGDSVAKKDRDKLADSMTPSQIEQAHQLAQACEKREYKNCDAHTNSVQGKNGNCPSCKPLEESKVYCGSYLHMLGQQPESTWLSFLESDFFGRPLSDYSDEDFDAQADDCSFEKNKGLFGISAESGDELRTAFHRLDLVISKRAEAVRQKKAEKEKELTEKATREASLAAEARRADLKSGKIKVASMKDAALLVNAGSVFSLAGNPLLTPDNKDYKGDVRIDVQENSLIRVQSELMGIHERRYPRYVYLKLSKRTVNFTPDSMRIGATISVIGKYVKNVNYRTNGGETKTAPVIECSYLGEPTGEEAADALKQMIQLRESMSK